MPKQEFSRAVEMAVRGRSAAEEPQRTANPPAYDQAYAAAHTQARAEGVTAERIRIKGILRSEQAQGREALARQVAFDTDLGVEQALTLLSKSPAAASLRGPSKLDQVMAAAQAPRVTTTPGPSAPSTAGKVSNSADIYAHRAAQARARAQS